MLRKLNNKPFYKQMKRSKRRHSKRSKKRSKRTLRSKRSKRSKKISRPKRRSKRSSKKVTRRLRTRLSPSGFVEKKEDCIDRRFYVLGLCSCDTRQQRDEIDRLIKDLQEKALLPMESYEIHMVNHTGKHQRPGCVPNESSNVFNKRFLFQFGSDPLPESIEKNKYTVIFNHYCPYMVLTDNIPLVKEMLRTDYSTRPYLINPASKNIEDKRYEQLTKSFDLIVPVLEGETLVTGEKKKWSVYQLKESM
jgi:hypothetical protein